MDHTIMHESSTPTSPTLSGEGFVKKYYRKAAHSHAFAHESTVAHEQRFIMDAPMISRTRSRMALGSLSTMNSLQKVDDIKDAQTNSVPHTRPKTPRSVTHNHDEDCSDEEGDPIKGGEEEE